MTRWSTCSTSKVLACLVVGGWGLVHAAPAAATPTRDPVTMRVVAVNPSAEKNRTVPVRIDLPKEVTPTDIVDHGELSVEYDTDRSLYYLYKEDVQLAPKQTKVFEVLVKDVWFIPEEELEGLKTHTNIMLDRLKDSEYYPFAKQLGVSVIGRLEAIGKEQADETISRKQRIGDYRNNSQTLKIVKEDLARMEKLLTFTGGPPVPEMMQESSLKSDAPSTTTTWLVIFLIVIFMGLLAGQFFFTWQRRIKAEPVPDQMAGGFTASANRPNNAAASGRSEAPVGRPPAVR